MDWSKIIDWLKLSPRYLIPITIVSGILLFLNEKCLNFFGLTNLINQTRPYISLIFLISIALIISDLAIRILNWGSKKISNKIRFRSLTKRLFDLTPEEKNILLGFFLNNTRTQYLSISDGAVKELEAFDFIYRSSNVGEIENWSYNIQPWAWKFIKKEWNKIFSRSDINIFKKSTH